MPFAITITFILLHITWSEMKWDERISHNSQTRAIPNTRTEAQTHVRDVNEKIMRLSSLFFAEYNCRRWTCLELDHPFLMLNTFDGHGIMKLHNYDLLIVECSRKATGRKNKSFRHCGERRERETRASARMREARLRFWYKAIVWETVAGRDSGGCTRETTESHR